MSRITLAGYSGTRVRGNNWIPSPEVLGQDWRRVLRRGEAVAEEKGPGAPSQRDIWWAVFTEAVQVSRQTAKAPPRPGFPQKSAWPESRGELSDWQLEMERIKEGMEMPENEEPRIRPPAKLISQSDAILEVYHAVALRDTLDWKGARNAVYLKACGLKARAVQRETGYNRQQQHEAKTRAMRDMADAIAGLIR